MCDPVLISDVHLYEESPSQYQTDVKRHHRWIRGDWQIGAWMLPFVTGWQRTFNKKQVICIIKMENI